MNELHLGLLAQGPHADLIREMAEKCWLDETVQAIWVGGSLAAGTGDAYSDVDFRIAVEPSQLDKWVAPVWEHYLPFRPCGGTLMRFGEQALLHHLLLEDGTIVDFYVQDTGRHYREPKLVVLACRHAPFRKMLEGFAAPAPALVQAVEGATVRQFLVDYWITTHKELKALGRGYEHSFFVGLYFERAALLRAWYLQMLGRDVQGRMTLHMLKVLHDGLAGRLTERQHHLLGLPSRTAEEMMVAVEGIRREMAEVGRWLAERHGFAYPHELEVVVQRAWEAYGAGGAKG